MPRLTNNNYLKIHQLSQEIWSQNKQPFTLLSPNHQLELHVYCQTKHDLAGDLLLIKRRLITEAQPTLPQSAGKHFAKIWTAYKAVQKVSERRPKLIDRATSCITTKYSEQPTKGNGSLLVVTNPEIDAEKLALSLLATAQFRSLGEQERLATEGAKIFKQLNTTGEKRRAA